MTALSGIINHGIAPVWDKNSEILILGSFPSVKSRESRFFYGNRQNRFWRVLSAVLGEKVPITTEEKTRLLLENHIALWDVIASCEIEGSSDSSIRNVTANDITPILKGSRVKAIFVNGAAADRLYKRYIYPVTGMMAIRLPSTSPANASKKLDDLIEAWKAEICGRMKKNQIE